MVSFLSTGSLLVALGLFIFIATSLANAVLADNEAAMTNVVTLVHYAYPIASFLYFIAASMATVFTFKSLRKAKHPKTQNRKKLVLWLSGGIIATYALHGILIVVRSARSTNWIPSTHENVYILSSLLIWGFLQLSIIDSTYIIWYPYTGGWYIGIVSELLLLFVADLRRNQVPKTSSIVWIVVVGVRIVLLILLPLLFYTLPQTNNSPVTSDSDEEQGLLSKQRESGVDDGSDDNLGIYGSFFDTESDDDRTKKTKAKLQAKWEQSGNWWNYAKSFSVFWPMIWPSDSKKLKFYMFMISLVLIGQSILNVLVPRQFGLVTDSFLNATHGSDQGSSPWVQVSLFILFKLLQSNAGLFAIKDYLWIPIEQYSYRMITTSAYNHILSLSYDFHCDRRSGELFASISNARSINLFIDMMLFRFIPMLADLFIAFIYLYYLFGAYMALLVAFVSISFLWSTTKLANYNQCTRRDYIKASRKEGDTMWETVSNWQNISYFNKLEHEQNKYRDCVLDYQKYERKWIMGTSFLKVLQSLVFTLGLLGASYLAVHAILEGSQPVGSFVTLLLYWTQLSGPLAFFADFFRRLNTSMIDAERVLEILTLKPSVANRKNAPKLDIKDGEVAFDTVHFAYDERKPALRGISLRAKPGNTVAIVGETGSGKSTLLRLLFRFYDVNKGSIKIDGQDIRDVTIESLREAIGVVPQDPSMFNDTIMNNLRYANFDATDQDIYRACEAAAIHSSILTFPDGYNSIVGERGVKLSGGELQRIAIARAIIKDPKIILLDEATSMVDNETERNIQNAFRELSKGRTTFVVAHRLSTIVNADQIIVVRDGKIKEIGTHEELLERQDAYHRLWNKQIRTSFPTVDKNKSKSDILNDLTPVSQNTQPQKAPEAPISQSLNAISTQHMTSCGPPGSHKEVSVTSIPPIPEFDATQRVLKPASFSHSYQSLPDTSRRPSTLKGDAPEYIPADVATPLPPTYAAATSSNRRRANSSNAPTLIQASQRAAKIVDGKLDGKLIKEVFIHSGAREEHHDVCPPPMVASPPQDLAAPAQKKPDYTTDLSTDEAQKLDNEGNSIQKVEDYFMLDQEQHGVNKAEGKRPRYKYKRRRGSAAYQSYSDDSTPLLSSSTPLRGYGDPVEHDSDPVLKSRVRRVSDSKASTSQGSVGFLNKRKESISTNSSTRRKSDARPVAPFTGLSTAEELPLQKNENGQLDNESTHLLPDP